MNKLTRGLTHGAIYAVVFCGLILMLTPVFNILLIIALVVGVTLAFAAGIFTNLRSSNVACGSCGRTFRAVSDSSKCPDCGLSMKDGTSS